MSSDYLSAKWRVRQQQYAREYSHSEIDTKDTFYGLLQRSRLLTILEESIGTVLDVGCADSLLRNWLAPKHRLVVGVDIVIPHNARSGNFVQCVAEYLPFRKDSLDTVIIGEIVEHVLTPHRILGEAYRVASRRILLSTPNLITNPLGEFSPDHITPFSYKTLMALLRDFPLRISFIKQPIFPPMPSCVRRLGYLWARNRYVVRARPLTSKSWLRILEVILRILQKSSTVFPMLSATLLVRLDKTVQVSRRETGKCQTFTNEQLQSSQLPHVGI